MILSVVLLWNILPTLSFINDRQRCFIKELLKLDNYFERDLLDPSVKKNWHTSHDLFLTYCPPHLVSLHLFIYLLFIVLGVGVWLFFVFVFPLGFGFSPKLFFLSWALSSSASACLTNSLSNTLNTLYGIDNNNKTAPSHGDCSAGHSASWMAFIFVLFLSDLVRLEITFLILLVFKQRLFSDFFFFFLSLFSLAGRCMILFRASNDCRSLFRGSNGCRSLFRGSDGCRSLNQWQRLSFVAPSPVARWCLNGHWCRRYDHPAGSGTRVAHAGSGGSVWGCGGGGRWRTVPCADDVWVFRRASCPRLKHTHKHAHTHTHTHDKHTHTTHKHTHTTHTHTNTHTTHIHTNTHTHNTHTPHTYTTHTHTQSVWNWLKCVRIWNILHIRTSG